MLIFLDLEERYKFNIIINICIVNRFQRRDDIYNSDDESIEKIWEYSRGEIPIRSQFNDYDEINKPITVVEPLRSSNIPANKIATSFRGAKLKSFFP